MKKYWKEITIVLLILLFLAYYMRNRSVMGAYQSLTDSSQVAATYWKDKAGKTHAKFLEVSVDKQQAAILYRSDLDSLSQILRISKKQITGFESISSHKKDSFVVYVDTSNSLFVDCEGGSFPFTYQDNYSLITGIVNNKRAIVSRESWDTLKVVRYTKGILWWKKKYVDIFNADPQNHIESITNMQIGDKKKIGLAIGPYIGMSYDFVQWKPAIGICVQYSLIKL